MANYIAKIRSNYFAVTDEAKLREIIASCISEEKVEVFMRSGTYGFGCYGSIYGLPANEDENYTGNELNLFYEALQSILAEDDIIIITEIGHEKLRYFIAQCTIISKTDIQFVNLRDIAMIKARKMLKNSNFTTQMDY